MRIRFPGLRSVTRSVTLAVAISATRPLTEIAVDLAHLAIADHPGEREITLVAVSVSNLVSEPALQLELPLGLDDQRYRPGTPPGAAHSALDYSLDEVRERFGRRPVAYARVALGGEGTLPDAFRELAEHDSSSATPPP